MSADRLNSPGRDLTVTLFGGEQHVVTIRRLDSDAAFCWLLVCTNELNLAEVAAVFDESAAPGWASQVHPCSIADIVSASVDLNLALLAETLATAKRLNSIGAAEAAAASTAFARSAPPHQPPCRRRHNT
jgi:hypothetical protein